MEMADDPTPAVIVSTRNAGTMELMGMGDREGPSRDDELTEVVDGLNRPRNKVLQNAVLLLEKNKVDTPGRLTALTTLVKKQNNKKKG